MIYSLYESLIFDLAVTIPIYATIEPNGVAYIEEWIGALVACTLIVLTLLVLLYPYISHSQSSRLSEYIKLVYTEYTHYIISLRDI